MRVIGGSAKGVRLGQVPGGTRPLTDREVPPTMRRSLPTDRPADPSAGLRGEGPRGSVAPPGF